MDEGWAFYSWAIENDGWMQFQGIKRDGSGYVAQRIERLMAEYQNAKTQHG